MPEANVLYAVTALVIAGLAVWVAFVLKTAKEPWARELPREVAQKGVIEGAREEASPPSSSLPKVLSGSAKDGADATAEATPVIVARKASDEKAEADEKADADEKAHAEKSPDKAADEEKSADEKKKIVDEKNG